MKDISKQYAKALFSLALEENKLSLYYEQCKEIKSLLTVNNEFISLLANKMLIENERILLIDKYFSFASENIVSFLKILVSKNLFSSIIEILTIFNSYFNEYNHIKEGIVFSAIKLDENNISKIESKISEIEGCKVCLINKVDSTLIGGVKVTINNHVYDGTVKNQIDSMKKKMLLKEAGENEN